MPKQKYFSGISPQYRTETEIAIFAVDIHSAITMKLKDIFGGNAQKTRDYHFGKYALSLNKYHVLDQYQEKYPLYDRFLPLVCSGLNGLIIDIGANIGDTSLAIFAQNDTAFIVGVEPDEAFFNECMHNINRNGLDGRFLGVKKFVSSQTGNFVVKKSDSLSTGSIEKAADNESGSVSTVSFADLMEEIPADKKQTFSMLKVDTDGFDWDILKSFAGYAGGNSNVPEFIFFEMQTFLNNREKDREGRDEIIEKYNDALKEINGLGYTHFCLFDNFGTLVKKTTSVEEIHEFNQYIKRSQINNAYSTIYYLDVLAYKAPSEAYVNKVLDKMYGK